MGGGGDDVAVLERRRHHAGRHQAADVRHVPHQVGAVLTGDLLHAGVVDVPGVAARPCWSVLRQTLLSVRIWYKFYLNETLFVWY